MTKTKTEEIMTTKPDHPTVVRQYKDTVFRMLFREKSELLRLFNAVNHTNYPDPDALEINTLENVVYMNMKNDLSCVLDMQLNLYEHQSTANPNMPLRNLFYSARLYEKLFYNRNIYSSTALQLPTPKFVVFYNGEEPEPERKLLRLSDLYTKKLESPGLELTVMQLNINPGFNEILKQNCSSLAGYMAYVEKVRNYRKEKSLKKAVDQAVQECIEEGILVEFLSKNRSEVIQMSIFEYDQEAHMQLIREESMEKGRQEGLDALNCLVQKLLADGRMDDLKRMSQDTAFRDQLLNEYRILEN